MQVWSMRTGISFTVSPTVRRRLRAVIADRNAPQKHVWRAQIVLLSADGAGTNTTSMMRRGLERGSAGKPAWIDHGQRDGVD